MHNIKFLVLALLVLVCYSSNKAWAASSGGSSGLIGTPGFGIGPWLQTPSEEKPASGRVNWLYSRNSEVYLLDLNIIGGITTKQLGALSISGLFNSTSGKANILVAQIAGLTNINSGSANVLGLQAAGGLNINKGSGFVAGFQFAALGNVAPKTTVYGAQVGAYNVADKVYGFQIGLLNVTNDLRGIQFGLLNIYENGTLKYFPLINAGF